MTHKIVVRKKTF